MRARIYPYILTALALLGPATAHAQSYEGVYAVSGSDGTLGSYTGQVELRDRGTHYDYVRLVHYQSPVGGNPLSTAWVGTGVVQAGLLQVTVGLDRIGWITDAGGMQRTAADATPDVVLGAYRPDPAGGLAATLTSAGGVSSNEALIYTGPPGPTPLFVMERTHIPIHRPMPSWMRSLLFTVFASYHALPQFAPHVHKPEFRDAVHLEVRDRTGFDWLRANPGSRILANKRVDAISLAEAEMRYGAYGLRLHEKAARYDVEASDRHLDEGLLAFAVRPNPNVPGGLEKIDDQSTYEWSGAYLFGQRCRYLATGDPQALQNVERMITVFCDMVEMDPRVGEFARSIRPLNRRPLDPGWHAGTGPWSHLAYMENGNNDMIKGHFVAFFAAWDVLPANHPLRPRIVRCVKEIADHWAYNPPSGATDRDSPKNRLLNAMLAFWITGESRYETQYKAVLREPMFLAEMAAGGVIALYGIGDWSGTHLGVLADIARIELGRKLGSSWQPLFEHALRMNWRWLHTYRSTHYSVVAASYLGIPEAKDEALWQLREFPYPLPRDGIDRSLDPKYCLSPWPDQPWKMDWLLGTRINGLYTYPVFMRGWNNFHFRDEPYDRGRPATDLESHGGGYLYLYWLARLHNVIPANE